MQSKKTLLFVVIGLTAIGASLAYAGARHAEENDAAALAKANISLTQAIAAAEQQVAGKAVRADLELEHGKLVYEVEVANGAQATDVKVDGDNGAILSAQADRIDHEGHEREDD